MKRFLIFALAALAFAACTQTAVEIEVMERHDTPDIITVGFEGDDTRIQLNEAQKTVWTKGDQVSVFYRSNANQQWKYDGETGARTANLKRVDAGTATRDMDRVVVVYPYNEDYYINPSTYNVQASLPATQTYLKNSYGLDGNIMISSAEYNDVTLKNVCGWLKLQLTGDGEVVKSITFKGNNGEQVAGELYINSADATAILASDMGDIAEDDGESAAGGAGANLSFDDVVLKSVTLDCGEGVTLGAEATAFYIALPPQTFENGFKVEIICADDTKMVKSTSNALSIERNHIQPMAAIEFIPPIPNNQIWYTSSDGNIVTPYKTNVFGATIKSNTYVNGKGTITFDGDVTTIGAYAFKGCDNLTSVTIPDSVTKIGAYAFNDCYSLTSVTIGDSVTIIEDCAFYYCYSLTSVTIPDSVTKVGVYAFSNCSSLTSVTIPDSVTKIEDYAFHYCSSLASVTIPDSVTTIGNCAFYYCLSLTNVTIPDSVTTIGIYAFQGCDSLTSVTIGDGVTMIRDCTFSNCSSLTSVTIGNSVTMIGVYAFSKCSSLTSVTIPDSVTMIEGHAFHYCTSLASVTIPDSVTKIGDYAFYNCRSLTSVTIGDSVTTIGEEAFYYCKSLTSVYCKAATPPALKSKVFDYNGSGRKIYVPTESVDAYKSAEYWSEYASAIVGYDF